MEPASSGILPFIMTELTRVPGRNPKAAEIARTIVLLTQDNRLIHPLLVLALIYIESGYSPRAISPVGARGLMQIMPATAAELAHNLGETSYKVADDLYEPVLNVRLGVPYMLQLHSEFKGSWPAALTAYNRGPHNVHKILANHSGLIPEAILDSYSSLVIKKYLSFIKRYPGNSPPTSIA